MGEILHNDIAYQKFGGRGNVLNLFVWKVTNYSQFVLSSLRKHNKKVNKQRPQHWEFKSNCRYGYFLKVA